MEATLTEELLPALLEVATCTAIQSLPRQLAYLVAAQYMARINPEVHAYRIRPFVLWCYNFVQVADRAIHIARNSSPDHPVQGVDSTEDHGMVTTKYFFSLGAGFLHMYAESHVVSCQ